MQSRNHLFAAVQVLNSEDVSWWLCNLQWYKDEYITSDSNYLWSIDNHCKLENWRIEIYAAIDVYFWKIIWIYVEITNHTSVSIFWQYIDTLLDEQIHLVHIWSDCDVETLLLTAAHHAFMKKHDSKILFADCYFFEMSTINQQIEAWWVQLTDEMLFQ